MVTRSVGTAGGDGERRNYGAVGDGVPFSAVTSAAGACSTGG
ncbi:hypothetical protein BN903_68 [Halorubrum sp. AJ67]|nr:hypothetical protein BN903_68 [Halorubrum sp. AJ67]